MVVKTGAAVTAMGLVVLAAAGPALGASATKAKPAESGSEQRLSLYSNTVAYMSYCGLPIDDAAVGKTLADVGLKTTAATLRGRSAEVVRLLSERYDTSGGKFDFCRSIKTIPVVKQWTAKDSSGQAQAAAPQ
jgi:hypothetical protein